MRPFLRTIAAVLACFLLPAGGCGGSLPEADDSPEGVGRAEAELVTLLSGIVGTWSTGSIPMEFVELKTAVRRTVDHLERSRAGIHEGSTREDLERRARLAVLAHPVRFDPAGGGLFLVTSGTRRLAEIPSIGTAATRQVYLDVLLTHSLAQAELNRTRNLIAYRAGARTEEEWICRGAALAGHAQYLVRRVAEARGAWAGQELQRTVMLHLAGTGAGPEEQRATRDLAGHMRYELVQGERFFEDLAMQVGYAEARERILRFPPASHAELKDVDAYLERSAGTRVLELAAGRLVRVLRERGHTCESRFLDRRELLAATRPADPGTVEPALRGVCDAVLVVATPTAAKYRIFLLATRCRDARSARLWLAAGRRVMLAKDRAMGGAPGKSRLISATYEELPSMTRPGFRAIRVVRKASGLGEETLRTVVLAGDRYVLEATLGPTGDGGPSIEEIAAKSLDLLVRDEVGEVR
ncbi:MAG: hypothetical protein ABFS86_05745 [Planctomycetota bacterium]